MKYRSVVGFIAVLGVAGCTVSASTPGGVRSAAPAPVMQSVSTDSVADAVGPAVSPRSADSAASRDPRIRHVTLPASTVLSLRLGSTVSSRTSNVEDPVRATVQIGRHPRRCGRCPRRLRGERVCDRGTPFRARQRPGKSWCPVQCAARQWHAL